MNIDPPIVVKQTKRTSNVQETQSVNVAIAHWAFYFTHDN
jgi:hypothetical protein